MSDSVVSTPAAPVESTENVQATPASEPKPSKVYFEIDGERVDEDTIKRDYKKWRGADGRFREAAQARKEMEAFQKALFENPEAVLNDKRIPLNRRQLAEKWLREHIEEEVMDPSEREKRELRNKLKQYEEQVEQAKKAKEQEERKALIAQRQEAIAKTLSEAMEMSTLSKHPEVQAETLREMALYMRLCKQNGYVPDAKELAQHVEGKRLKSFTAVAGKLKGDELISFLGESVVSELRKADLARIRKQREAPEVIPSDQWQDSAPKQEQRKFIDPYSARINK